MAVLIYGIDCIEEFLSISRESSDNIIPDKAQCLFLRARRAHKKGPF